MGRSEGERASPPTERKKKPTESPRGGLLSTIKKPTHIPKVHLRRNRTSSPISNARTPREKPHSLVRDGNRKSLQAITKQFGDGFLHDLDDLSRSPLHVAAIEGQLEILKFLVDRGQSMEACDNNGWTPLHHACHTGHMECAIYLLAAGADPWAVTFDNETVLHFLLPNHHLVSPSRILFSNLNLFSPDDRFQIL